MPKAASWAWDCSKDPASDIVERNRGACGAHLLVVATAGTEMMDEAWG